MDQFSKFGKTVYDLYRNMELPSTWLKELKNCCTSCGIDFLATPFDERSADILGEIGVPALKVASFEITHIPLLKHLGGMGLPIILSTGMASLGEIESAIHSIQEAGEERIALLHCGIEYPAAFESVDLRCIQTMKAAFGCPVGYSDHTLGITVPIAAVALGADLFEKHVTLFGGTSPDHDFALDMDVLETMVSSMRHCESALGSPVKRVHDSERKHLLRGRRSIFVVKDIREGEVFSRENIAVLRPGVGIPPVYFDDILGRKAKRDVKAVQLLERDDWF
jgi:sialic acid synthase SpsE